MKCYLTVFVDFKVSAGYTASAFAVSAADTTRRQGAHLSKYCDATQYFDLLVADTVTAKYYILIG